MFSTVSLKLKLTTELTKHLLDKPYCGNSIKVIYKDPLTTIKISKSWSGSSQWYKATWVTISYYHVWLGLDTNLYISFYICLTKWAFHQKRDPSDPSWYFFFFLFSFSLAIEHAQSQSPWAQIPGVRGPFSDKSAQNGIHRDNNLYILI